MRYHEEWVRLLAMCNAFPDRVERGIGVGAVVQLLSSTLTTTTESNDFICRSMHELTFLLPMPVHLLLGNATIGHQRFDSQSPRNDLACLLRMCSSTPAAISQVY